MQKSVIHDTQERPSLLQIVASSCRAPTAFWDSKTGAFNRSATPPVAAT
jgi:hypothetical protein